MKTVKSLYTSQDELLGAIRDLHCPEGFECDLTYGNGSFWREGEPPRYRYDIDPQSPDVTYACSTDIPHDEGTLGSVVFDPPFLTYVRAGRGGNGKMLLSRRFGGYWSYQDLTEHYCKTLDECARVMRPGGKLIFKCQDIVHNHRLHATHINVVQCAERRGFWLKDNFILAATHRLPAPNRRGKQKHSRIFHSHFLVLCRMTPKQERNAGLSVDAPLAAE